MNKSMHPLWIWMDGKEIPDPLETIDLAPGRRTLTLVIDRSQRGDEGLRVELVPTVGSPATYQPEGGV